MRVQKKHLTKSRDNSNEVLKALILCLSSREFSKDFSGPSWFLYLSQLLNLNHETGCLLARGITAQGCVRLSSTGMLWSRAAQGCVRLSSSGMLWSGLIQPSASRSPWLRPRQVPEGLHRWFDRRIWKYLKYGALRSPASVSLAPATLPHRSNDVLLGMGHARGS